MSHGFVFAKKNLSKIFVLFIFLFSRKGKNRTKNFCFVLFLFSHKWKKTYQKFNCTVFLHSPFIYKKTYVYLGPKLYEANWLELQKEGFIARVSWGIAYK